MTALKAVLDAESRSVADDDRTRAQKRADALGEICRQWLDLAECPTVAGERPHVTVTVDAAALGGGSDAGELDHAGPVGADAVRRLACDASVMRVVMSGRSEPLDVGRRTPVVPPSMRRAVTVRDRRCRFPGCDRPHTWCDAHHVVHWADGEPTALSNLVLLCRRHHRMIHWVASPWSYRAGDPCSDDPTARSSWRTERRRTEGHHSALACRSGSLAIRSARVSGNGRGPRG